MDGLGNGYFKKADFDQEKIYEVHGSVQYLQCMDKNCNIRNGVIPAINTAQAPHWL